MSIIDGISSEHSLSHLGLLYHTSDGDYYHFMNDTARNFEHREWNCEKSQSEISTSYKSKYARVKIRERIVCPLLREKQGGKVKYSSIMDLFKENKTD